MNVYGFDLIKEAVKKARRESDMDWLEIKDHFAFDQSAESLRKYSVAWKLLEDWNLVNFDTVEQSKKLATENRYKETTEIKQDGTHASDKLVAMSEEDSKDVNFLLKAHGFDSGAWELLSAKNNIWNVSNGDLANKTLYSSKITVKPIANGVNFEELIKNAVKDIKPYTTTVPKERGERLLEIPLVDMHFGINDLEYYKDTLQEIVELIHSKTWHTIYIPIGNDLLHHNNFKGHTASGTQIEKIDLVKAWEDAFFFYSVLYDNALKHSNKVVSHYVPGNHDTDFSWGFVKALEVRFPQIEWDTSMSMKKFLRWNDVALIQLHGDKGSNRVVEGLLTKYRDVIVGAKCVEIHSGHLHSEKSKDKYGILIRTLATQAQEDEWHVDQSFEGSVKTFQLFEYTKDKLKNIHYI